jgi:hypothetical protein
MGAGAWAAMPIGALAAGVVVEQLGLTTTLVGLGCAYMLVVLSPLLGGPWRDMERSAPEGFDDEAAVLHRASSVA